MRWFRSMWCNCLYVLHLWNSEPQESGMSFLETPTYLLICLCLIINIVTNMAWGGKNSVVSCLVSSSLVVSSRSEFIRRCGGSRKAYAWSLWDLLCTYLACRHGILVVAWTEIYWSTRTLGPSLYDLWMRLELLERTAGLGLKPDSRLLANLEQNLTANSN